MSVLAADTVGSPGVNITIFLIFVAITLVVVARASRNNKTASDYYAAGRAFTGPQNGIAISGDYLSAASFLGIAGAIAINGYDGFLYSIGFLVAWLVALLLVAELLRNTGKFTMGDVLSFRMQQKPVRAAAAITTVAVSLFYLIAQMAGAGGLVALLLGVESKSGQNLTIAVVGAVMIFYVLVGGMKGTTWVQIIKATLLIAGTFIMTAWVLGKYGLNLSSLLGDAVDKGGETGEALLGPGKQYGLTGTTQLDFISLSLALVLGTAGLPHVLMRFYTVPTAKEARRSVVWAIWLIGIFYLMTLVLGYGAAALVGPEKILAAPGKANSAAPLLAYELGGTLLLGIIAAVAFATILAVVAGLTITASASFAHDVYANVIHHGRETAEGSEVRVARITAVVIGIGRHPRWHPGQRPEHRLPGRAGLRGRGVGEPADDPLHALLEAVQHPWRAVQHVRRADQLRHADHLLAGRLREAGGSRHDRQPVDDQGHRQSTSTGSRSTTRASSRSRCRSCLAGSAR